MPTYIRTPYAPDSRSILDLMRLASADRARSDTQKAAIRTAGIVNLGQLIAGTLASIREDRDRNQLLAQRQQQQQIENTRQQERDALALRQFEASQANALEDRLFRKDQAARSQFQSDADQAFRERQLQSQIDERQEARLQRKDEQALAQFARDRDDARADKALEAQTAYQNAQLRISQQNADTARQNADTTRARYTGTGLDATMPAPLLNALDRSILTITSTKRGPIVNLANRLWTEGNEAELKGVIKQAAIEGENVDTKNQVLGRQATMAALSDARTVLQQMKRQGVPTNWLSGSAEDLARRLGTTTNPRYVELGNQLADALIAYRRAATGVSFGEREGADYARMFPNYRQTMPVNEAAITGLENAMKTHDRAYWTHKLGEAGASAVLGIQAAPSNGVQIGAFTVREKP